MMFTLVIELGFTRRNIRSQNAGNPYSKYLKKLGRYRVIEMYREYLNNKPELLALIPMELKDKTLGCWCKPKPVMEIFWLSWLIL